MENKVNISCLLFFLTGMTVYRNQTGNKTVEYTVVMDTAGVSVLVSATQDLLNIMVLVGSEELKGEDYQRL